MPKLSEFVSGLKVETAFDVLAQARKLKAGGKDVVELQIGDSPFPSATHAIEEGIAAIKSGQTHYGPSIGLPDFRAAAAERLQREYGIQVGPENVVVGPGAKVFEQFFCEAFLNPGDEVLVFTPDFPTYRPNIARRQAVPVFSALRQERQFRPNLDDVANFSKRPKARAIFLNSPHNPTGGVATKEDLEGLAELAIKHDLAVFSDEPYDHMVWSGRHHSPLEIPGMMERTLACYTFSKSYSMSGWRLGYAVGSPAIAEAVGKLVNTTLSCVPPFVQIGGAAALRRDDVERNEIMQRFRRKVELLTGELSRLDGVKVLMPAGTFYVFPNVAPVCNRLGITSHGLALYLLEGADDRFGVACLGGECFGEAGAGFLRFSCAEPDERLVQAIRFLPDAWSRTDRMAKYLSDRPQYRLTAPYPVPG